MEGGREGDPKESTYKRVLKAEWVKAEQRHKAERALKYLVAMSPLGRREQVRLGPDLRMVSPSRTGGFWTAASLARAYKRVMPELGFYEALCRCCNAAVFGRGGNVNHVTLVECTIGGGR